MRLRRDEVVKIPDAKPASAHQRLRVPPDAGVGNDAVVVRALATDRGTNTPTPTLEREKAHSTARPGHNSHEHVGSNVRHGLRELRTKKRAS